MQDVAIGDQVMATDPETGEKGPRTVEALIRNTGPHTMVAVGTDQDTIDATDNHPFWVQSRGEWVEAVALQPGGVLFDEHGNDILVTELAVTDQDLTAYNLTIEDLHTYYAGNQPTLVHNCDLGEYLAEHMQKDNRTFDNIPKDQTADYIEAVIHDQIPMTMWRKGEGYGREIWRDGRNIIIQDLSAPDGGTAFSKSSQEAAIRYWENFK
ncbi:MAG: polymorphic toxin-type HINT domain-containing protein [Ancrocorticia sp.]